MRHAEISPADELQAELQAEQRGDVAAETAGMAAAFNALQPLGDSARRRALDWLRSVLDPRGEPPF